MKVSWPDLIGSRVMLTSNKTVCTKNRSKDAGSSLPTFSENPPFRAVCSSKVRLTAPATSTRGIRLPLRLAMYARRWRPPVGRPPACCLCLNSSRRATGVHRRCGHFSPPAPATGELLAARGGVCARRTTRCATRPYRRSRCHRRPLRPHFNPL